MPALAVAAEEEEFVLDALGRVLVQSLDLVVEAFPLGLGLRVLKIAIRWVGAVDKAEVGCGLWKSARRDLDYVGGLNAHSQKLRDQWKSHLA